MRVLDQPNFKLTGTLDDPSNVNFDLFSLHKKRTIIKGELKQIDYYKEYNLLTNSYSDLILTENRDYIRNDIGIIIYRDLKITWYLEDDNIGLIKICNRKYFSPEESIQEGIDRRNNMMSFAKTVLLNELKLTVGEPTNQSYAFDFLLSVSTQMNYFKEGYTQPLRDAINSSTKPYLSQGIKDKVITELTF